MIYTKKASSKIVENSQTDTNNPDKVVTLYSTEELKKFINKNPDKLITVEIDIAGGADGTAI